MKVITLSHQTPIRKLIGQLRSKQTHPKKVETQVRSILHQVKRQGDRALIRYTLKFDGYRIRQSGLRVSPSRIREAYKKASRSDIQHLRRAAKRIRDFHQHQKMKSWTVEYNGARLGQLIRPLDTVGIYVPGGKAAYPSSVLMNAIPAWVAGVSRIVMCSPTPRGETNPYVLIAADIVGVREIYTVGGAQAIGALAYGTSTIPKVDKIVGPGNQYVAVAKRMVMGVAGIDMFAGPSEIVVIADDSAKPNFIAADLLSQAEHDEDAMSILVTTSTRLIQSVQDAMEHQIKVLPRRAIIKTSLRRFGMIIHVKSLKQAIEVANLISPEHLELAVQRPNRLLPLVQHAGAVFLGHYTTESLGDYVAGPNHVLPTGGTARFASPLSTEDFLKKTSLISFTKKGLMKVRKTVVRIALMEGLQAHAQAVEERLS